MPLAIGAIATSNNVNIVVVWSNQLFFVPVLILSNRLSIMVLFRVSYGCSILKLQ